MFIDLEILLFIIFFIGAICGFISGMIFHSFVCGD